MYYHGITKTSVANGTGIRTVLWVSGCNHHCNGCHNPQTWDVNSGQLFDDSARRKLMLALSKVWCNGLTFSGGDPLHPQNRDTVTEIAKEVKDRFPDKDIWLYTGYTFEEVKDLEVMQYIDILVDGEFIEDLRDLRLKFKGSANQRIIDVKSGKEQE